MMETLYVRERRQANRSEDGLVPDAFFRRFGPDTASVVRDMQGKHLVMTFADLGRRKRQRQAGRLENKRQSWGTERRAGYVWVFFCPGVGGFVYRGWWTYIIARDIEYGRYLSRNEAIVARLMELFPLGGSTLFGPALTFTEWMPLFARTFCCRRPDGTPRKHAGRVQGKALVWLECCNRHIDSILGRAFLPEATS